MRLLSTYRNYRAYKDMLERKITNHEEQQEFLADQQVCFFDLSKTFDKIRLYILKTVSMQSLGIVGKTMSNSGSPSPYNSIFYNLCF